MSAARYWLLKSEPDCFSIQHLAAAKNQTTYWSGVRNYQARNFMRDDMRPGDQVLFYHSSADPPAVAGTATIVKPGYPDHTAQDSADDHYDPKHTALNPIWYMVDIKLDEIFPRVLPLEELRGVAALAQMELLKRGSRLSVQPVSKAEYDAIVQLAHRKGPATDVKKPSVAAAKTTTKPVKKPAGRKG
ncbi:MAG: EVE domain-containing protein [Planctomycetia bacterium]|nr:EVE domain-containing protein [Planctomycetia bacterium]